MPTFATFPHRAQGFALLLLRCSAATLLLQSGQMQSFLMEPRLSGFVACGLALCLCAGLLTPILGTAAMFEQVIYLSYAPAARSIPGIITALVCLSVGILGAGAYSLDGVFYGRKRIIL